MTASEWVQRGYQGVKFDVLSAGWREEVERALTFKAKRYQDDGENTVKGYSYGGGYLRVPRYFALPTRPFQEGVELATSPVDETVEGVYIDWQPKIEPIEERGQVAAIEAMTKHLETWRGGILEAGTGFGKTYVALLTAARFKRAILILVYNEQMMLHWRKSVKAAFGLNDDQISIVQGDSGAVCAPVAICMIQTLTARSLPVGMADHYGVVIGDECHHMGAPLWGTIMSQLPARYRIGVTAEATRDDGLEQLIQLHFGPVAYRAPDLRKQKPAAVFCEFQRDYPSKKFLCFYGPRRGCVDPLKYRRLQTYDAQRNAALVYEFERALAKGRKLLCLTHLLEHVHLLKELWEWRSPGAHVGTLIGGNKDLEEAMSADVMLATYSFAREALDVPRIDTLFFLTSPGKPLQPTGRLRDLGPERQRLMLVDCCESVEQSQKSAYRRFEFYREADMEVQTIKRKLPGLDDPIVIKASELGMKYSEQYQEKKKAKKAARAARKQDSHE